MKGLEKVSSGMISEEELRDAIIDVGVANGRIDGQEQVNELVDMIINS